jgi:hypothetical protein
MKTIVPICIVMVWGILVISCSTPLPVFNHIDNLNYHLHRHQLERATAQIDWMKKEYAGCQEEPVVLVAAEFVSYFADHIPIEDVVQHIKSIQQTLKEDSLGYFIGDYFLMQLYRLKGSYQDLKIITTRIQKRLHEDNEITQRMKTLDPDHTFYPNQFQHELEQIRKISLFYTTTENTNLTNLHPMIPLIYVEVDDPFIDQEGFPLNYTWHAKAIQMLNEHNAQVILLDIMVDQYTSDEGVELLEKSLQESKAVFLGIYPSKSGVESKSYSDSMNLSLEVNPTFLNPPIPHALFPLKSFVTQAKGVGLFFVDSLYTQRNRIPLLVQIHEQIYPHVLLEYMIAMWGVKADQIYINSQSHVTLGTTELSNTVGYDFYFQPLAPESIPTITYSQLFHHTTASEPPVLPAMINDATVVLGQRFPGTVKHYDNYPLPLILASAITNAAWLYLGSGTP